MGPIGIEIKTKSFDFVAITWVSQTLCLKNTINVGHFKLIQVLGFFMYPMMLWFFVSKDYAASKDYFVSEGFDKYLNKNLIPILRIQGGPEN